MTRNHKFVGTLAGEANNQSAIDLAASLTGDIDGLVHVDKYMMIETVLSSIACCGGLLPTDNGMKRSATTLLH
ncbi:hypothetical protein KQH82_03965 [bacterium]|nr:hypothetical protein [bacterium]